MRRAPDIELAADEERGTAKASAFDADRAATAARAKIPYLAIVYYIFCTVIWWGWLTRILPLPD